MTITLNQYDYIAFCRRADARIVSVAPKASHYEVQYIAAEATCPDSASDIARRTGFGGPAVDGSQGQLRSVAVVESVRPDEAEEADSLSPSSAPETRATESLTCPKCGTVNNTNECEICQLIERAHKARNRKAYEYAQEKAAHRRENPVYDPSLRD